MDQFLKITLRIGSEELAKSRSRSGIFFPFEIVLSDIKKALFHPRGRKKMGKKIAVFLLFVVASVVVVTVFNTVWGVEFATTVPLWAKIGHNVIWFVSGYIYAQIVQK